MWLAILVSTLSLGFSHLPPPQQRHIAKSTRHFIHSTVRHSVLSRNVYVRVYGEELNAHGTKDEVAFLSSLVEEESGGDPLAVSYIPGTKPLWHCGLVQTQCRSWKECRKVQHDPRYAARKALKMLRWMDKWPGSRVCNWKQGPFHKDCRTIRAKAATKIPVS